MTNRYRPNEAACPVDLLGRLLRSPSARLGERLIEHAQAQSAGALAGRRRVTFARAA